MRKLQKKLQAENLFLFQQILFFDYHGIIN